MATAIVARSSRSRSSRRWEISVPSASVSGSRTGSLMWTLSVARWIYRWGRSRWRGCRCDLAIGFLEGHFLIELLSKLPGHCSCAAHPASDLCRELRQALGTEHDERQAKDQHQLGKANLEHQTLQALRLPEFFASALRF